MKQTKEKWYNKYFASWFPIKLGELIMGLIIIIVLAFIGVTPY